MVQLIIQQYMLLVKLLFCKIMYQIWGNIYIKTTMGRHIKPSCCFVSLYEHVDVKHEMQKLSKRFLTVVYHVKLQCNKHENRGD